MARGHEEGEYPYEASYDGPSFQASVVGYSDDSGHEAVENLVGALEALGLTGTIRVHPPHELEPVTLAGWRSRADEAKGQDDTDGVERR